MSLPTLARVWLAIWPFLFAPPLRAQLEAPHRPIRFERSDVEPFLPQSSVYAIHQDRRGFLWFGTREGLSRWDGYEMRTWKATPFATDALPANVVGRVVEDRQGSLWVYVQPTDQESARVARLVGPDYQHVQTFDLVDVVPFIDRAGGAWLAGTDSLYRFDETNGALLPVTARLRPGTRPHGALVDRSGLTWVGTANGVLEVHDVAARTARLIEPDRPWRVTSDTRILRGIFEDDRGTIWLTGLGLRRLNATRTRIEQLPVLATLDSFGTADIVQDPDGWIWLATFDGVYRLDPSLTHIERHSLALPGDIATQNYVVGLLRDRAGSVWAGTVWGLHRYDPAADVFGFLAHDPDEPNTLGSGLVVSLLEDAAALWVGTLGGGLNRIDRETGTVRHFRHVAGDPHSLNHNWVWSLANAGGGRVWAGTGLGLALIDPNSASPVQHIAQTAITGIYALHADTDGVLWLGTDTGLLRRATDGVVQPIQLPARALVNHILRDGDTLWLGTSAGLMWQNVHTGESRHYRHNSADTASLSHDVVLTLRRDRAGRLWVGTNSGLNRFDAVTGRFTHYADINTLPSSVIYSIVEDDDSRLWLSTNRGLARFDPGAPAGTRIRSYDGSSGTGNIEFNRNAGIIGHDGALYFGGDRGVTFFHPASLRDNPNVPPVVITALERSTREGTRRTRYVADAAVTLAPDDYTVSFEFAALNFTSPHRNRYAYRLDGFDPQWIDAGNGRSASYTNLPPGKYVFRVRAANDDGVWNEAGAAVPVLVRPWFWETWWFRTFGSAALLLLASATTGLFLYNRNRRLVQSIRYQSTLERERSRISRDMHDEVGASLTEIAILSELALQRNGQSRSSRAPLEKIAGRSRAMLDSIGQIIWALNPDNDRLQHLSAYLRAYAADFLDSAGIEARLHFETAADAEPVTAEFRRNIFLVMKEALVNVAKHAHASHALVELRIHGRNLSLRIVDDGRGLVPDGGETSGHQLRFTARGHNGLGNARRRAEELGGILTVISAPDAGTSVHLDVPLPEASVHRAVSS